MKTYAFLNNKGGVGKSSSVQAIAYNMAAKFGKKVLVIDIDPQANTTIVFSRIDLMELLRQNEGITQRGEHPITIEDLLIDAGIDIKDAIQETEYEGLDIIRSLPTLAAVEEQLKADIRTPQQFRLRNQLSKLDPDEYDYCLIDCGPSLSILNINALVAADEVFIPTQVDSGSLWGVSMTIHELISPVRSYSPQLTIGGIFITRCKDNVKSTKEGFSLLQELYPDKLLPFTINENAAVSNSNLARVPLPLYDKYSRSQATKDYRMLTEYILAPSREKYIEKLMEG